MKGYGAEFREPRNVNHFVLLSASSTGGRMQGCEIKALPVSGILISLKLDQTCLAPLTALLVGSSCAKRGSDAY